MPTAAWPACSARSATSRCRSSSRPRSPASASACWSTSPSARKSKRQLRQAKEEAERRADEAEEARAAVKDREHRLHYEAQLKDEFLATLAHELRNPLAPLRNVAEILRMEALSETARHATGVMERQIGQLVRLIDDLMDVSRITRGQLTLRKERVDLRSIIDSAVETAQPQLTTAGVTPRRSRFRRTPLMLDADATRISQVVLNLLTNAAKFTPSGGRVSVIASPQVERVALTCATPASASRPKIRRRCSACSCSSIATCADRKPGSASA